MKDANITYDSHSVSLPTSAQRHLPSSVLIHLPRGPSLTRSTATNVEWEPALDHLAANFPQSTVLSINYRLSAPYAGSRTPPPETCFRYPQPIHDVSDVFTYITEDLVPSMVGEQEWPQIQLYGSRFGGALAAMLALTMPNAIDTVVVEEPIVDWVMLDELLQKPDVDSPMRRKASTPFDAMSAASQAKAAKHLINVRAKLFTNPSSYFDAFASPTLFVRAPGRDTPRTHAEALGLLEQPPVSPEGRSDSVPIDDTDNPSDRDLQDSPSKLHPAARIINKQNADDVAESAGSFGPYDDDIPSQPQNHTNGSASPGSSITTSTSDTTSSTTVSSVDTGTQQVKRRKVLRRWPPNSQSEDALLPLFNIIIPSLPTNIPDGLSESDRLDLFIQAILRTQGTEFAELLKRACFLGRESSVAEDGVTLTTRHNTVEDNEHAVSAEATAWLQSQLPR